MERKSQQRTQIQRRGTTAEAKEGKGGERTRGWINRWNADVSVISPDPLISSPLSMWLLISVSEPIRSTELWHQTLCTHPTHPMFDLPLEVAATTSAEAKDWQRHGSPEDTLPSRSSLILSFMKAYLRLSSSSSWTRPGGSTSLSLTGLFAGTLLNVNFAKGVILCRRF